MAKKTKSTMDKMMIKMIWGKWSMEKKMRMKKWIKAQTSEEGAD
jgi:hypothetical protein